MRGLIIKDIYSLKKYWKSLCISMGFLAIYGIFLKNITFLSFIICFLSTTIILTILGDDEVSHWDKYALCMPLDRKMMVREKYAVIVAILLTAGGISIIFGCIMAVITKQELASVLQASFLAFSMVALIAIIITPVFYKLGVQKARYIMIFCVLVPAFLIVGAAKLVERSGIVLEEEMISQMVKNAYIIIPLVLAVLMYVSYRISVSIYTKKEW